MKTVAIILTLCFLCFSGLALSKTGILSLSKEDYVTSQGLEKKIEDDKFVYEAVLGNIYDTTGALILENTDPIHNSVLYYDKSYSHLLGNIHLVDNGLLNNNYETLSDISADDVNNEKGYSMSLTINDELQRFAYSLTEGERASIVVMKRHSGEILAMTSTYKQDFDLSGEDYSDRLESYNSSLELIWNPEYLNSFNPGSSQKIFSAVVAYETGMQDFTINDKGIIKYGEDKEIPNYDEQVFGPDFDLPQAFRESGNVYFASLFNASDIASIRKLSSDMLLNRSISTDFGTIQNRFSFGDYSDYDIGLLGIGQKNELSPVGICLMVQASIDNEIYRPHVIKNTCYTDKKSETLVVKDTVKEDLLTSDMISDDTCTNVQALMVDAAHLNYMLSDNILGAKSGTAEIWIDDVKTDRGVLTGYNEDYIVTVCRIQDDIFGIHNADIMEKVFNKLDDISVG